MGEAGRRGGVREALGLADTGESRERAAPEWIQEHQDAGDFDPKISV